MGLKRLLKPLIPRSLLAARHRARAAREDTRLASTPPAEVFATIYRDGLWGQGADGAYYSGFGSHDAALVAPYVQAVRGFLASLPTRPDAVDLGCGDFNVGRQLRDLCARYVACDVVDALIAAHSVRYQDHDVRFARVDLLADALPAGEVAMLRQVLQHLSNAHIAAVLPKLRQYRWLVLCEHLPATPGFRANLDKPTGPGIRLRLGSGVVLTEAPFAFAPLEERLLASDPAEGGLLRTTAYRLRH